MRGEGIEIFVAMKPKAWARPRFHGKRAFVDAKTQKAKKQIAKAYSRAIFKPFEGPLKVVADFIFSKPRRVANPHLERFPGKRPDVDNLCKLISDSGNEIAWHDDSQIVELVARKIWAAPYETEGVYIQVIPL